ncbi:MAG: hypothetical protein AB1898_12630 [Acidobacteriota bacterium]
MGKGAALLGLILALAIGYYYYAPQIGQGPGEAGSLLERVDVTGVKSDLLAMAQAERLYLATHGTYGTLDELQRDGALTLESIDRRGYRYTAQIDGANGFKITAQPSDPTKAGWPSLVIDETMAITQR